jgi:hypothetical protein
MGNLVIRGKLILNTTPGDGSGDPLLARDNASGEVGLGSSALAVSLTSGQIIVGNGSNQAAAVNMAGDVTINNTGVTAISSGVIVNADVNNFAAITLTKLAATTPNRALVSDTSGFIIASSVTDTELFYLGGVNAPIQTQLNNKQATITGAATTITSSNLTSNRAVISNGAGKVDVSSTTSTELGYLNGTTSSVQTQLNTRLQVNLSGVATGDVVYFNGIEWVNLPRGSSGQTLQSTGTTIQWGSLTANGLPSGGTTNQVLAKLSNTDYDSDWKSLAIADINDITATAANINILTGTTVTNTEFGYLSGTTSAIQTQLNNKQNRSLAYNALWVGNGSNLASELAPGTSGDVLTIVGSSPQWQSPTPPGNVSGVAPSTDNAIVRWNGTGADSIQNSGLIIDDSNNVTFPTGTAIRTGVSATNTLLLQAYDVDGASYTTFGTLTAANTPTFDLSDTVTKGGQYIYRSGGTDVSLADGGTGASLTDPGADRILFWDDSGNAVTWLTIGSNLSITGTTLNATGGGGSSLQQKEVATTTYLVDAGDDNYVIYFTNAAGCDVTLPSTLTANFTFTSVRASGGGTVDHLAGGTSVINTVGGATDIQNEDTAVTWIYKGSDNWYGFGALGSSGGAGVNSVTGTSNRITLTGTGTDPIVDIAATYVGQTSLTTLGTIGTGTWQGTVVGTTYGGTGLSSLGTNGQLLRVNAGATALEYFTPTYISGNQTITLTGDVAGSGTTGIVTTIQTNTVTDGKLRQSAGLSIVGRSTNTTGNVADITAGSDFQILRRSGTSVGFGSIDLSQSSAVGSSILGLTNGGTGSSSQVWWGLTGTSTLTGSVSIESNAPGQLNYGGTFTTSGTGQYHSRYAPAITMRATTSDTFTASTFLGTFNIGANNQTTTLLDINPTVAASTFTGATVRGIIYNPTISGVNSIEHVGMSIASGRVGIGTLTPATSTILEVRLNTSGEIGRFRWESSNSTGQLTFYNQTNQIAEINVGGTAVSGAGADRFMLLTRRTGGTIAFRTNNSIDAGIISAAQKWGLGGVMTPTAMAHLPAGTATANTAPLKITAGGTLLTTPESGAIETTNSHIYWTDSTGTRYQLDQQGSGGSISGLTSGRVPYATSATTITDEAGFEYDAPNNRLSTDTLRVGATAISGDKVIDTASSSTNANLGLVAKGTGVVTIGSLSTGSAKVRSGISSIPLQIEAADQTTGAYIVLNNDGTTIIRNNANNNYVTFSSHSVTSTGSSGISVKGGAGTTTSTFGSGDGVVGTNSASDVNLTGGNAYTISGNGNGGSVLIQSGQRRTAGSGVDGDVIIDPRTGSLDIKVAPITSAAAVSTHAIPIMFNGVTYWVLAKDTP